MRNDDLMLKPNVIKIPIKEFNNEESLENKAEILEDNDRIINVKLKGKRARNALGHTSKELY